MDKEVVVCVNTMEYYLTMRKKEILRTCMHFEGIMISERNQTEKDQYCMISFICGIYKTQQSNDYNKKISRLTDVENKLVLNNGEGSNLGIGD